MPHDVHDPDERGDDGSSPEVEEIVTESLDLQEQLRAASRLEAADPLALDADTVAVLRARLGEPPAREADILRSRAELDASVLTLATGILMERHRVDMIRAGAVLVSGAERLRLDPVAYARAVVREVASRHRP